MPETRMPRCLAILVGLALTTTTASAQLHHSPGIPTSATSITLENAFSAISEWPGVDGIWVYAVHGMSVPCVGPRGCYAKSDRIYMPVRCPHRATAVIKRISMDLNGQGSRGRR